METEHLSQTDKKRKDGRTILKDPQQSMQLRPQW